MPLCVNFIIIIFLFIVSSPTLHGADNENYTTCHEKTYDCGDQIKEISYPFWGEDRLEFCGVQGFKLTCKGNENTTIVIEKQEFRVLHINQSAHSMTIARADLWDTICPAKFINTTLNWNLFDYGPHPQVNLTLFYDCFPYSASYHPKQEQWSHFQCPGQSSSNISFAVEESLLTYPPNCKSRIKVPVFREALYPFGWDLEKLVKQGFEAAYHEMDKIQACDLCNASGGECGTNTTTNQAICFCHNGPQPQKCQDYENFYPNNKKEAPKGDEQKSESKDFEVTCTGGNPVVAISDDDYVIEEIFYTNNSFLLANSMVYDFENTCPIPLHNFSIEGTPYNYSLGYVDLFFFYNCSTYPIKELTYRVDCASSGTDLSFAVFHKEVLEYENYLIDSCNSWVNAPVETADIKKLLEMNFTDFLRRGFVLQWSEDYCSDCKRSGGNCGSINNKFTCFCSDKQHSKTCDDGGKKQLTLKVAIVVILIVVGATILVTCASLIFWFRKKTSTYKSIFFWRKSTMENDNVEAFLKINGSLVPQRYSYSRIKTITNSFQDKLGKGGYGDVYKGKLLDGRLVAVKLLNETKGNNGEEFINEVTSISRTSHVNIVSLVGYCFEGRKRALIYEYMPNGSLEKFIHNKSQETNDDLEWKTMHKIAVEIARGLEYLHRGCTTRIFHFDIKPHNILLDEDFCPKISDFGLAKLCPKKESIVSMLHARGTIGYIAPEVFSRHFGIVSHKADVYSYGMLVLEMVQGKENIGQSVEDTSNLYFPHSIYKKLECDGDIGLKGIESEEDEKVARKMILVSLCCIQANPLDRPAINKVIEMLKGNLESLQMPPEPFLSLPSRTLIASSTIQISEENESCEIESM